MRWTQENRDSFHGECDLVLLHSDGFHGGLGFDLHVRTTVASFYSYVETAAVRVGDNVVQVLPDKVYFNGQEHDVGVGTDDVGTSNMKPLVFASEDRTFKYFFPVDKKRSIGDKRIFYLFLNGQSHVEFRFWKNLLTVSLGGRREDFGDAIGLLGRFDDGQMISRDNQDFVGTFETYGFEWQVNTGLGDPSLFIDDRSPQLPYERCRLPTAARPSRRHLRHDQKLYDQAVEACTAAQLSDADKELCIDDVVATGEVDLASIW